MTNDYVEEERRTHSTDHYLLLRVLDGQAALREDMKKLLDAHCKEYHKDYAPDHHEQHKRFGAWLRRIDGMWDNTFKIIGTFLVIAFGYGLLVVMRIEGLKL